MKKLIIIGVLILAVTAFGQTEEYPHVMDNGGGRISDGTHNNLASIGQAVAGISDDGTNTNQAGYITAVASFELGVEEETTKEINQNLKIYGNYPNPFKEMTKVQFVLPQQSEVKFSVYNIAGNKLLSESKKNFPAGKHNIKFEAGNLSSGVYIYKLEAGDTEKISKMIITK